jgi:hypothetical protein
VNLETNDPTRKIHRECLYILVLGPQRHVPEEPSLCTSGLGTHDVTFKIEQCGIWIEEGGWEIGLIPHHLANGGRFSDCYGCAVQILLRLVEIISRMLDERAYAIIIPKGRHFSSYHPIPGTAYARNLSNPVTFPIGAKKPNRTETSDTGDVL